MQECGLMQMKLNLTLVLEPTEFGWRMVDGCFHPDWYSGPACPRSEDLQTFISEREKKEKDDADTIDVVEAEWTDSSDDEVEEEVEDL